MCDENRLFLSCNVSYIKRLMICNLKSCHFMLRLYKLGFSDKLELLIVFVLDDIVISGGECAEYFQRFDSFYYIRIYSMVFAL